MLHRKLLHSLTLLLVFVLGGVLADTYTKPQFCVQACYQTIASLSFRDYDKNQTYVGMRCHSRLAVSSIYACYNLRCASQFSFDESFGGLIHFCEEYGYTALNGTYDEVIQDIVAEYGSVENVPVIHPKTMKAVVNTTVLSDQEYYDLGYKTLVVWQHEEHMHHAYGWSMYCMAAGIVFLGTVNRLVAFIVHRYFVSRPLPIDAERFSGVAGKGATPGVGFINKAHNFLSKHILLPATFGYRHIQPWGWCTIPTRIQSILVFVFFALNFIFCAVDWHEFPGNTYWAETNRQFWRYFADRTGIIAFYNLPLVWLFAGRNDVLLWITGWSFSTYNVFHRYIARIATVQGILHSIAYTVEYWLGVHGWSSYKAEVPYQWFWCGIAATVVMSFICGFSILPFRAYAYEFFLFIHIGFSVMTLIFLFLHVRIFDGEYDAYLWTCVGFWVFDRFLRLVRLVALNWRVMLPGKNDPLKRSEATVSYDPDGDIIRLTVRPSTNFLVGAGIHYYIYTPTSSAFRLWENHPFTLGTWKSLPLLEDASSNQPTLHQHGASSPTTSETKSVASGDVPVHPTQQELMFLIRPYKGMTQTLKNQLLRAPGYTKNMRVLLEGPYGVPANLRQYERVLMLSGGSGVTGLLAYMYEFEQLAEEHTRGRTLRFAWAAREPRFVADVVEKDLPSFVGRPDTKLDFYMTRGEDKAGIVEQALARASKGRAFEKGNAASVIYGRPDFAALLDEEIGQLVSEGSRLAVVVCGPGRLADDIRREVVRCIGTKIDAARIELYEESFGW